MRKFLYGVTIFAVFELIVLVFGFIAFLLPNATYWEVVAGVNLWFATVAFMWAVIVGAWWLAKLVFKEIDRKFK